MATLPKINRADYQIGGGVALRLRTQGTPSDEEFRSFKERISVAGDGPHTAPKEWRTWEENRSSGPTHNPDTTRDTFNQRIEMDSEKSDLSDGLRALESSIRISAGNRDLVRGGIYRTLVLFLFTGLIALGATFVWHYHGKGAARARCSRYSS